MRSRIQPRPSDCLLRGERVTDERLLAWRKEGRIGQNSPHSDIIQCSISSEGSSLKFQKMSGWGVLIATDAMPVYPVAILMLAKRRVKVSCIIEFA